MESFKVLPMFVQEIHAEHAPIEGLTNVVFAMYAMPSWNTAIRMTIAAMIAQKDIKTI